MLRMILMQYNTVDAYAFISFFKSSVIHVDRLIDRYALFQAYYTVYKKMTMSYQKLNIKHIGYNLV